MSKGLDLSAWQSGLSLSAVKAAGWDFAILRGGYTGYGANRSKNKDTAFEKFYAEAKRIGLPVGCYYYSCANTKQGGIDEANFLYDTALKGKQFEFPIYIDVEDTHWQESDKKGVTDAIIGFCDTLENKGYFVGVYASLYWFNVMIDTQRLSGYTKWVAAWMDSKPSFRYNAFDIWQNSSSGYVAGTRVDTNFAYRDFPSIIKAGGYNGFPKSGDQTEPPKKTVDELAHEVIEGKWGNGAVRKSRLTAAGYDYDAVQNRVNELMDQAAIHVGDTVEVVKPVIYGTTKQFAVYYKTYKVMELVGNRAVIGVNGVVTAAVNVKNLRKV